MIYLLALIALIILLLILWFPYIFNRNKRYDHYDIITSPTYQEYNDEYRSHYDPYDTHTNFPFWNSQLGSTRNMSYDLRGDVPIPHYMNIPFNMGTRVPIRNKPLYLAS